MLRHKTKARAIANFAKFAWGVDIDRYLDQEIEGPKLDISEVSVENNRLLYEGFLSLLCSPIKETNYNFLFLADSEGDRRMFEYRQINTSELTYLELEDLYNRTQFVRESFSKELNYCCGILSGLEQNIRNLDQEYADEIERFVKEKASQTLEEIPIWNAIRYITYPTDEEMQEYWDGLTYTERYRIYYSYSLAEIEDKLDIDINKAIDCFFEDIDNKSKRELMEEHNKLYYMFFESEKLRNLLKSIVFMMPSEFISNFSEARKRLIRV